jgi:hypothetical protein
VRVACVRAERSAGAGGPSVLWVLGVARARGNRRPGSAQSARPRLRGPPSILLPADSSSAASVAPPPRCAAGGFSHGATGGGALLAQEAPPPAGRCPRLTPRRSGAQVAWQPPFLPGAQRHAAARPAWASRWWRCNGAPRPTRPRRRWRHRRLRPPGEHRAPASPPHAAVRHRAGGTAWRASRGRRSACWRRGSCGIPGTAAWGGRRRRQRHGKARRLALRRLRRLSVLGAHFAVLQVPRAAPSVVGRSGKGRQRWRQARWRREGVAGQRACRSISWPARRQRQSAPPRAP